MYKGDIPFNPRTGQPMYYPERMYAWTYKGNTYESWLAVERKFGNAAGKAATRIDVSPDWRANEPFDAVLTITGFSRGRSAANFDFQDDRGTEYTMFMTDLLKLFQTTTITNGKTQRLTWVFCKRGQNYGIQLHEDSSNGP